MAFETLRADLTSFLQGEPYTALTPGTATNYSGPGYVQIRGVMVDSSGELGTAQFSPLVPSVTILPDDPGSVPGIDEDFHSELKEAAVEFWRLYIIAITP